MAIAKIDVSEEFLINGDFMNVFPKDAEILFYKWDELRGVFTVTVKSDGIKDYPIVNGEGYKTLRPIISVETEPCGKCQKSIWDWNQD